MTFIDALRASRRNTGSAAARRRPTLTVLRIATDPALPSGKLACIGRISISCTLAAGNFDSSLGTSGERAESRRDGRRPATLLPSLRDLARGIASPSDESLGYSQSSLRD